MVVRPIARIEDGEGDAVEVISTCPQLVAVDRRNPIRRISEGAATERAEHGIAYAGLDQRVQLSDDSPATLDVVERQPASKILGRGPQLDEREDLLLGQPPVAQVDAAWDRRQTEAG